MVYLVTVKYHVFVAGDMRIIVTGGTGLIGRALVSSLTADGIETVVLSRRPQTARAVLPTTTRVADWTGEDAGSWRKELVGAEAIVHLGGASIGTRPWTAGRRRLILSSRVQSTDALVAAIEAIPAADRPRVLVSASGMDFYGDRPADEVITEASGPGTSFLASVCRAWESSASRAQDLGVRVALSRTGFVIDRDASAFRLLALPSRLGLGARLGTGEQGFTWIHLADVIGLLRLAISDSSIQGPMNVIAPEVPPQREVVRAMARVLHRPAPLRVPERLLRLGLDGLADLLLHGRFAQPTVAIGRGYGYRFPTLDGALTEALGPRPRSAPRA